MPPRKTAGGARAASETASEDGGPATDASAAATAANASSSSNSKPTKQAKGKTGKKGEKAAPEDTHRCYHCQTEGAKMMCCSQCHRAWYCGKPCQKKHWKQHKKACVASVAAGTSL